MLKPLKELIRSLTAPKAFEDELDLDSIFEIKRDGEDPAGGWVLRRGDNLRFNMAYLIEGAHIWQAEKTIEKILHGFDEGLKRLPQGESIRIHHRSISRDDARQQELEATANSEVCQISPELKFLTFAEQRTVRELTQKGIRQEKELLVIVSYTIREFAANTEGFGEELAARVFHRSRKFYKWWRGERVQDERNQYKQWLKGAATRQRHWHDILQGMGLSPQPLNRHEVFKLSWEKFNRNAPPPEPFQYLVLKIGRGKSELEVNAPDQNFHITTGLIKGSGRGRHTPIPGRDQVVANGERIATLTFDALPQGFASPESQLKYFWRFSHRFPDIETIVELKRDNPKNTRRWVQVAAQQNRTLNQEADRKNEIDAAAKVGALATEESLIGLAEGRPPLLMSGVVLVKRPINSVNEDEQDNSDEILTEACDLLCQSFPYGELSREDEVCWETWLAALPESWRSLLPRQFKLFSDEVFLPLATTIPIHDRGFELIAAEGGAPLYLDLVSSPKRLFIIGQTGSGKSALLNAIFQYLLANGVWITLLDFAREDGTSTSTHLIELLGQKIAAWFDLGTENHNLFELEDDRQLSPKKARQNRNRFISFLVKILELMILGGNPDEEKSRAFRTLLGRALHQFFNNPAIMKRYQAAWDAGMWQPNGELTPEWRNTPTLIDFERSLEDLDLSEFRNPQDWHGRIDTARIHIQEWINSPLGNALCSPTTINLNAPFLAFGLPDLEDDDQAAIVAMSAQLLALRRAMRATNQRSILAMDESSVLSKYKAIAESNAMLFATGRKRGVGAVIATQDPDSIAHSGGADNKTTGQQILQNTDIRVIGVIQPSAIDSCCEIFNYTEEVRELLHRNTTPSFQADPKTLSSNWFVDAGGRYYFAKAFLTRELLSAVANMPWEEAARKRIFAQYPGDKFQAWATFAALYEEALRRGISMEQIGRRQEEVSRH